MVEGMHIWDLLGQDQMLGVGLFMLSQKLTALKDPEVNIQVSMDHVHLLH